MSKKIKYSIVIIGTLLIGMIIGFLVGGRITSTRVERMQNYYTDMGFHREFMNILRPTPEQRDEIIPILKKYASYNCDLMSDFREGQKELFFDLKDELEKYLNDDQIKRLDHVWEMKKQRFQNTSPNHPRKGRKKPSPN
jgi:hypothetical protein